MAAIRSEGGLLPADVLARVAALDRDLGGLTVSDFHLAPNERLGEAIARSWARLTAAWEAFSTDRDGLPAGDHAGRLTRERWLLPLFSELGYGRLVQQPGVEIEGKTYAVFCEYNHSPVHLVGAGVPLDRRTAGVRGAADQSPHSVVQELLNRSTERLWGIVTNGLSLRLLRDNVTLTRQAYVEFDLEAIFATEAYEDFALLWLCAHQSRLEAEAPEECWLERWTQAALRDGTRALGELRSGVERAIEALGRGFLAQVANARLHEALRDGELDGIAYYRQLLRLVYRLLFLFVAEDRDVLLLPDDNTPERHDARARYAAYYGTQRLRRLGVRRRGGRAYDLYEQVKLLCGWLHATGQPVLALPPLGSALWDPATTAHISDARLGNEPLLDAIRELAFVEGGRRPVDFRNLGAEELGSVYESLLELHPEIDRESARFTLTTAAGHDRKQTGSYYTPTSLIGSLLETALDPVIEQAVRSENPERALLDLTVCDPACGSGHFLIAAANRIAKRVAAIREQDPEPPPEAIRHALRDVVSRCIHGVDMNPMAVELCKVSLWLEALEPGRPLSFLDDRILLGNSLLGTTPALINAGIPEDAFKPLLGDDKEVAKAWRQHNARESKGQTTLRLDAADPVEDAAVLAALAAQQRDLVDDSPDGVSARADGYRALLSTNEHARLRLAADTWSAAFTTPKQAGAARLTTGVVRRAAHSGPGGLTAEELDEVRTQVDQYHPLHWHVAFPAVFRADPSGPSQHGWAGGFDCVLGNPPWERVKLQEKEFFAVSAPTIAEAKSKAARERMIAALQEDDPSLHHSYVEAKRRAEGESHLLRSTGRYPLCGRGDVNTYAVFAENMRTMLAPEARLGVIVPTGIATDDTTKLFFGDLVDAGALVSLYDFENRSGLFADVDSRMKFCLLTIAGTSRPPGSAAEFAFFAHQVEDLNDPDRRFALTAEEIVLLNPNTKTCPIFRGGRDAEITKGIYRRVPVLLREGDVDGNPWGVNLSTMFHMSNDARLFRTRAELEDAGWTREGNQFVRGNTRMLPLYEGRFGHQFNHRFASQPRGELLETSSADLMSPDHVIEPQFWVSESDFIERVTRREFECDTALLGFRRVARDTDERTTIASLLPWGPASYGWILVTGPSARNLAILLAGLNSFAFDYCMRGALSQPSVPQSTAQQLPMPTPSMIDHSGVGDDIVRLTAQLAWTAHDLDDYGATIVSQRQPFAWDPDARSQARAHLDAIFMWLFGLSREEVAHILDSFPIVRRKDEKEHNEFRTKRLILQAYDQLATTVGVRSLAPTP